MLFQYVMGENDLAVNKRILNGRVKRFFERRTSNVEHRMMKSLRSASL